MAEFTFDLNQLKASSTRATSNIESGLYSNTKDEDLIYTGNDTIVWDRSNAERLRRGLPSLAAIGYPRPPEDETATQPAPSTATQSNSPNLSSVFKVKGPEGLTREQALAIFKKQADTGSLIGFKPGESLSAATQEIGRAHV